MPAFMRQHDGTPVYRKRDLYRLEQRPELAPLFERGLLDEGSPTSWSTSVDFAEKFGKIFDDVSPNAVAGAIFMHVPDAAEVVLNIPRLWGDPSFLEAAESYRSRDGAEAKAVFHFRDERDQFEIILRAPLRRDEIFRFGRTGSYEGIYALLGATTPDEQLKVDQMLAEANIDPLKPRYLSPEGTQRALKGAFDELRKRRVNR